MPTYPKTISSDHSDVYARLAGEHYRVSFPYSADAVAAARAALKAPTFDPSTKTWLTKKRWHKQLPEQLNAIAAVVLAEDARVAEAEAELEERKRAEACAGREAFAAMEPYSSGISATVRNGRIRMRTAYHSSIVSLFRNEGGRFDRDFGEWSLPLAAGVMIAANRQNIADWHNETVRENQERAAAKQRRRSNRFLSRAHETPAVGAVIPRGDSWVCVTGTGKTFVADEDTSSLGGPVGAEGERICYVYYEPATDDQIAQAQADLAAAETARRQHQARREAIKMVALGEAAPHTGEPPAGRTIWEDDRSAAMGLHYWIVLADDGFLYHLTYDGSDGAAWGDYNAGRNTRASRLPATDELTRAIMAPERDSD